MGIMVPICYFLLESRKDPARLGLMYLCTFTLLKISGERNFGVALNKAYFLRLPVDVPLFSGTHADLLIITLHKLIVAGIDRLSALYNCFLTIICNISPYCKTLSTVSSVKLVNLFQLFTSTRFLYAAEGNHIYVPLLFETFNNIIQYQYEGNANMVYAIVKRRELFDSLANLTLPLALKTAAERAGKTIASGLQSQTTTESSSSSSSASASSVGGTSSGGGAPRMSEKASTEEVEIAPEGEARASHLVSTQSVERKMDADGQVVDEEKPTSTDNVANNGTSAAPSNSSQEFVPNEAWLTSVKGELPLNTIMRLLKYLTPQLEEISSKQNGIDEQSLLEFVRRTTLVGLLPVPHPIVIRKYQPNKYTSLWFSAFLWGVIFMHNQDVPLFDGKNIKLFIVQTVTK